MKADKVLLDEPCNILHESYVLSCKVSNLVVSQAPIDIYIRLRGFENDSPLILFRDFENRMKEDLKLNLIFSIENDIGAVLQIDFVMDVPDMEDDIMVASLTDVELRRDFQLLLVKPLCDWLTLSQSLHHCLIALSSQNQFANPPKKCHESLRRSSRAWCNRPKRFYI